MRVVVARGPALIRVDALLLCTQPHDMCAGAERLTAQVVPALGRASAHHGYHLPTRGPVRSSCSCTTASACGVRRGG